MFNKKGTTLMEVIISIALISIVLAFMIKLLVDLNNTESNNSYAKSNQINRTEITRLIMDDIKDKEITRVTDIGSLEDKLVINFEFSDRSSSTIECNTNEIVYTPSTGSNDIRRWTLDEGEFYVSKANIYYNRREDTSGNFRVYTLTIDIEIHTPNDINNSTVIDEDTDSLISYNNPQDDILISYVGAKEIELTDNIECLGYACNNEFVVYNKPLVTDVITSSNTNSITLAVTASEGDSPINNYYYSINDGEYISSTSNRYTFNNLTANTTYNFRVYVDDTLGYFSNVYNLTANTSSYISPVVNSVSITGTTANSISVRVNASGGTNNVARYYYSINNGSYSSSTSNSYTFNGLTAGQTYNIRVYVTDTNRVQSNIANTTATTDEIATLCNPGTNLATCIKSLYSTDGVNDLYYHNGSGTYGSMEARDNSYRYSGASPDNYVCFGTSSSSCSSSNLYRIIGVFGNQVKLMKNSAYGEGIQWSCSNFNPLVTCGTVGDSNSNDWSISQLSVYLNDVYLNGLGSTWSNKIATSTWYIGGGYRANISDVNARTTYNYEVGSNRVNQTQKAKIALMYVSDFSYAAEGRCWSYPPTEYNQVNQDCDNWMKGLTQNEWTLSRIADNRGAYAIQHSSTGMSSRINVGSTLTYSSLLVRPAFYLNSNVTYTGGMGTMSDPIRIN